VHEKFEQELHPDQINKQIEQEVAEAERGDILDDASSKTLWQIHNALHMSERQLESFMDDLKRPATQEKVAEMTSGTVAKSDLWQRVRDLTTAYGEILRTHQSEMTRLALSYGRRQQKLLEASLKEEMGK
jgi:hypothetical protein